MMTAYNTVTSTHYISQSRDKQAEFRCRHIVRCARLYTKVPLANIRAQQLQIYNNAFPINSIN